MEKYQLRVIAEYEELNRKAQDLYFWIASAEFLKLDMQNQNLLTQQYDAMLTYSIILKQRIELFK